MSEALQPNAPAGGFAAISKYNPHLWSAEQLRAIFVARQHELSELLDTLRTTPVDSVGQHTLLIGARGMGKSTLMQRLALAVDDDAELRTHWLALRFPEEQYTVNTVGQFWANVLDSLIDALEQRGQPTQALDAQAQRLAALPAAEQAAACLDAINHCADQYQQRLLLLVDNTDLLLHNIGAAAHWSLRQVLQSNARLLWVGGSYQSLEADSHYHDAFLDFFRNIELRPLRLEEMQQALLALAATFGGDSARHAMQSQLHAHPERLPTLRQLSGGNPRTTVMFYELLAHSPHGDVRSDLEALLDAMTPLYKARMDALAELPRKLLAHVFEHWAPISLGQLADASQVAKSSISPQLQRLQLDGLIEKTPLHGTTRSGYQAAERFFNIWYLMRFSPRRQRARLAWLVEFMRLWFSQDELCHLARQRLDTLPTHHAHEWDYERALADALPPDAPERYTLRWRLLKELQDCRARLHEFFDFNVEDRDFKDAADYRQRLRALPEQLRRCPHAKTEEEKQQWVDAVMGSAHLSLAEKEQIARETPTMDQARFRQTQDTLEKNKSALEESIGKSNARTLYQAILNHDFFPDCPDSKLAYDQIRTCFNQYPIVLITASLLLRATPHHDSWELKTIEMLEQHFPQLSQLSLWKGQLLQLHLNRHDEAEAAYRQAISFDKESSDAHFYLGFLLLSRQEDLHAAEAALQKSIELENKNYLSWFFLGFMLQHKKFDYVEAERAYRQAIHLNEHDREAKAGLAQILWKQEKWLEAKSLHRQILETPFNTEKADNAEKIRFYETSLQAHLCLANRQLAVDILQTLVQQAEQGDNDAFNTLKWQTLECHDLGLGERLADWMSECEQAGFLLPFTQALYTLAGAQARLQDVPQETRQMAEEIIRLARQRATRIPPTPTSSTERT
ncbi:AAA family ATPase [Rivihabitans pingtungensis]|uniref:AAA family ATPase n=1 Tax=Rivihabitans pingtungensis TaxID=1054498 RepID=UPI0023559935|nr:AAA family ATPase [Rivihabitans pingtungensis]MCK6436387.1 AAA family ATPase [Rivihabitans pingtungensis]